MKTSGEDIPGRPSSEMTEGEWLGKKQAILKRISSDRGLPKVERENLSGEKKKLLAEVGKLEEENHIMAKSVKDFELQLSKRRKIYQTLFKESEELKGKFVRFLAREHNLINEIELCESEKALISDTYSKVSEKLRNNISSLEGTVKDIGFMKGEVQMLIKKMEILEGEIPVKSKEMHNLDRKVMGAIKALKRLYNRMQVAERDVKISYYQRKNNKEVAMKRLYNGMQAAKKDVKVSYYQGKNNKGVAI